MTTEAIIELVRVAFRAVPRPTYTLADALVDDEWGEESYRFEELDQRWEDIPDKYIERTDSAFCFLPTASWSYYIPAYMVHSLRHATPSRISDTAQRLIMSLEPTADRKFGPTAFRRTLTPEQRHAVAAFLSFWRSGHLNYVLEADIDWWDDKDAYGAGTERRSP